MKYIGLRSILRAWLRVLHYNTPEAEREEKSIYFYHRVYTEMLRELGKGRRLEVDQMLNDTWKCDHMTPEIKLQEFRRILLESGIMTLMGD